MAYMSGVATCESALLRFEGQYEMSRSRSLWVAVASKDSTVTSGHLAWAVANAGDNLGANYPQSVPRDVGLVPVTIGRGEAWQGKCAEGEVGEMGNTRRQSRAEEGEPIDFHYSNYRNIRKWEHEPGHKQGWANRFILGPLQDANGIPPRHIYTANVGSIQKKKKTTAATFAFSGGGTRAYRRGSSWLAFPSKPPLTRVSPTSLIVAISFSLAESFS